MMKQKFKYTSLALLMGAVLAGCTGDDGLDGAAGSRGEQGVQGEQGIQGEMGQPGMNGKNTANLLDINLVGRAVLNAESPEGAAEIVQYQKSTGYIYAINSSGAKATVEILDANNMDASALTADAEGVITNTNLSILMTLDLSTSTQGDANSIAISDELEILAVAMAAPTKSDAGSIAFYDISGAAPAFIKNVTVGSLPDMVAFSPDSSKVVVANEGEPNGDYQVDPEGTISIIDVTSGQIADTATQLDFKAYNDKQADLESMGVMFANPTGRTIKGTVINTTVAMDLEPEYVAITDDSKMAYVSMQENNALAVVDLETNTLTRIIGLGFKDWSHYNLDASDKDGGMNFRKYNNLYGMYQPDTITTFSWNNAHFIVTANEGDGREYFFDAADEATCLAEGGLDYDSDDGCLSYIDESRVEDLSLDADAFAGINNDDDDLGRLKVTTVKGDIDSDGDYEALYTYGARSFTIWDSNGLVVFDSGDDVGLITAAVHGAAFNNDEDENEGDTRSDAKGAEPESVAIGEVDGRTYAFVGLERMSGVMIYDISNPFDVNFVDYFYNRGVTEGADITGDLAPEGMKFIPATGDKPAMLVVGNEISGSVAVWTIQAK
nr:choice-of-anchor I family protein [Algibacillus agarilyticus]